jgi:hypothetical protein
LIATAATDESTVQNHWLRFAGGAALLTASLWAAAFALQSIGEMLAA